MFSWHALHDIVWIVQCTLYRKCHKKDLQRHRNECDDCSVKVKLGGGTQIETCEETGFCKIRLAGKMIMRIVEEN